MGYIQEVGSPPSMSCIFLLHEVIQVSLIKADLLAVENLG